MTAALKVHIPLLSSVSRGVLFLHSPACGNNLISARGFS